MALIAGVVIAKKGYDSANPHLITVFLVSTGIVLLYERFFGVFQQKANVDNNATLFAGYSKLLSKIDTYCATGKIPVVDPASVFNTAVVHAKPVLSSGAAVSTAPVKAGEAVAGSGVSQIKPAGETLTPTSQAASFYISLDPDGFINYVGWQLEQLRAISIAFDDSKIVAINEKKLVVMPD